MHEPIWTKFVDSKGAFRTISEAEDLSKTPFVQHIKIFENNNKACYFLVRHGSLDGGSPGVQSIQESIAFNRLYCGGYSDHPGPREHRTVWIL